MKPVAPLVSIVCPAFQEEEVLPHFHAELSAVLAGLEPQFRFEVLYVDDGSSDGTLAYLRQLVEEDPRVGYFSLSRNFGHQAALTAGLEHARGEAVIAMDSDLQHPPAVLPAMLEKWEQGHDVVLTIRQEDKQLSLFKRTTSALFYKLMGLFSNTEIRLAAADFRLLSRPALEAFLQLREQHRFVRGMVQWLGFRTAEISFMPDPRRAGQSKYTLRRMLRLAGDGLFSFTSLPLRLPVVAGLAVWGLGLLQLGGAVALGIFSAQGVDLLQQYQLTLLHLLGGGLLCALGTIGEYLGRVYDEVRRRPLYLLRERSPAPGVPVGATVHPPRQRNAG